MRAQERTAFRGTKLHAHAHAHAHVAVAQTWSAIDSAKHLSGCRPHAVNVSGNVVCNARTSASVGCRSGGVGHFRFFHRHRGIQLSGLEGRFLGHHRVAAAPIRDVVVAVLLAGRSAWPHAKDWPVFGDLRGMGVSAIGRRCGSRAFQTKPHCPVLQCLNGADRGRI